MKDFKWSFVVTAICIAVAGYWGAYSPMGIASAIWIVCVLAVLEVSLSFDNAVVNAKVLKDMTEQWRQLFLTVGILIAVFGMRLIFPIAIVCVTTSMGVNDVTQMALNSPDEYAALLQKSYPMIAAFGGIFLLLVFLDFIFDDEKELHWLGSFESQLGSLSRIDGISVMVALAVLFSTRWWMPQEMHFPVLAAGVAGVVLYLAVGSLGALFESPETGEAVVDGVKRGGFASFMYLEVLDASFSFDGVIGAFAITRDVVIIMLGLAIGAMFVRSMTVYLVHKGTLEQYVFLEHGAHYAIGILGAIMLIGTVQHVPEWITGGIGLAFIVLSVMSSIKYRKQQAAAVSG